ncbi:hypothetical protein ACRAWD_04110 [Caulobacter segnis]
MLIHLVDATQDDVAERLDHDPGRGFWKPMATSSADKSRDPGAEQDRRAGRGGPWPSKIAELGGRRGRQAPRLVSGASRARASPNCCAPLIARCASVAAILRTRSTRTRTTSTRPRGWTP